MSSVIQLAPGATEADILNALTSLPDGGTVILPPDETIAIKSGLNVDVARRDITIDLNGGTLKQGANVSVITARGAHTPAEQVTLSQDAVGRTTVTYADLPDSIAHGAWLKIVADDMIPGDRPNGGLPTRMGQALQVASIDGNTVTLTGTLVDQDNYRTNTRATEFLSGELIVKNGEIVGNQDVATGAFPLVQLRNLIDAKVDDITIRNGVGKGVSVVDSVNASITDVVIKNLADGSGSLGIGVHSLSSFGTTVAGLYAENVTHAADANAIGNAANSHPTYYGADIGMDVSDSVAYAARNFAWTWHSEVVNASYDHVLAMNSYGFLNARGIDNEITNSGGANNQRGIILYEWGDGDAREITIDTVTLKETLYYSTAAINQPRNNQIIDSWFESYGYPTPLDPVYATTTGTTYLRIDPNNENDVIAGSGASELLLGGKGDDLITGGGGADYIWGGAGNDTVFGGLGRDRFAFHDMSEAGDIIGDFEAGLRGDQIDLSVMRARLDWEAGDPIANGYLRWVQSGSDVLVQINADGVGDDFVTLTTLTDTNASSLSAANVITTTHDPDSAIIGTPGNDVLNGDDSDNIMDGGAGADRIYGHGGHDWLIGGDGNDTLYGGDGNDVMDGGAGADVLSGSYGSDTVIYTSATESVVADLTDHTNNAGGATGDRFSSIENLTGSAFDDVLRGNQVANVLEGGAGNDRLMGMAGNDVVRGDSGDDFIDGGPGRDTLTGGSGSDTFYFASIVEAGDRIADFSSVDHIALSGEGFSLNGLPDIQFVSGEVPQPDTPQATILYETQTGRVLWDNDGTGSSKATLLATLDNAPTLSLHDFLIV